MRKTLLCASIVGLAIGVSPACATKNFVRTEVGQVDAKLTTLTEAVEATQARTTANEARIGEVDGKAEAAARSANAAQTAADAAAAVATEATTAVKDVGTRVTAVGTRVDAVEAETRRLIFEVTLSEAEGNFAFGRSDLPEPARARIDEIVRGLKARPGLVFIEIEGHTDNVGSGVFNKRLGLERAEAAKQYLHEQHQIPLHKMNVTSYGEDKPVAPNQTRDGRAQNRRIVIRVLS